MGYGHCYSGTLGVKGNSTASEFDFGSWSAIAIGSAGIISLSWIADGLRCAGAAGGAGFELEIFECVCAYGGSRMTSICICK